MPAPKIFHSVLDKLFLKLNVKVTKNRVIMRIMWAGVLGGEFAQNVGFSCMLISDGSVVSFQQTAVAVLASVVVFLKTAVAVL